MYINALKNIQELNTEVNQSSLQFNMKFFTLAIFSALLCGAVS